MINSFHNILFAASCFIRPIIKFIFLIIIVSTCNEEPTAVETSSNSTGSNDGYNIYTDVSIYESTTNNIIDIKDTIKAQIFYDGLPSKDAYVEFNLLNNAVGTLTPPNGLTDSLGVVNSIYEYYSGILSDTIITIMIDVGAGNDASAISVHDTVILTHELTGLNLDAIEYFNFYPNNLNLVNLASVENEISVIARDIAGVGLCNIPVRFQLIGDSTIVNTDGALVNPYGIPNGVIDRPFANTCETNSVSEESEANETYGLASLKYSHDYDGIDYLIAKIVDPENDTLNLFADTIKIETVGNTLLLDEVSFISANPHESNFTLEHPDLIKMDTIYARALDENGALIEGIPFQFKLTDELTDEPSYNGAAYLLAGGAITDTLVSDVNDIAAFSILYVHPTLFDWLPDTYKELYTLNVSIEIPSTEHSTTVQIVISNGLPSWYEDSAELELISEAYILPCATCINTTSARITATLQDSINNAPPTGTIIEFSSLQKDTTGSSGEVEDSFTWVPFGNISPGSPFDSEGETTVDFNIGNDRGIAYIIGTVEQYDVSDTIQIIVESTGANHIEILPPDQDEIMVKGGGGIEYSEVFVQITDDAGNIVYDEDYLVHFELTGTPEGATLENGVAEVTKTTDSGESSVTIVSGTAPGSVHLTVKLFNPDDCNNNDCASATPIAIAESIPLTIVTGPPEYGELNFSVIDMTPIPGGGIYEYPLSVYLEDIHSNPVADSTSIYFKIREKTDTYDASLSYNYEDKATWLSPDSTNTSVLDSIVYVCINQTANCPADRIDNPTYWEKAAHPAVIVGEGEVGMASPIDGLSHPGVAFTKILFGSNSIAAEVIVFAQAYSNNSIFIIDSRTNHSGDGIVFPCYECSISLIVQPTQWDFSQFPFNVNAETDVQNVTVIATVTDYFQFPVYNAEILLDAPQASFLHVCNGEDTDLDGVTGTCTPFDGADPALPLVLDCWTCIENYAPDYSWVIENNGLPANALIQVDDLHYARTSSTGVGQWIIQYSEGVNIPTGTTPDITYATFSPTLTVSLITPSTNNPVVTTSLLIVKSETD